MPLERLLADQAGVLSRDQALATGLSRDTVDQLLRRRRWRPVHPRVYLVAGHHLGDEARVRAALLWAGGSAVLDGAAAAWWHGLLARPPATVGVTVARPRAPRSRPGVDVHRRALAAADRALLGGLAVTAAPLTVLETAVELGGPGVPLLDGVLAQRAGCAAVCRAYRRGLGGPGSAAAGRVLAAAAERSAVAAAGVLVGLLRESGIAGWRCGVPVGGCVIDVAFPAARLAVQAHGLAWRPQPPPAPTGRGAELAARGWTLLRYGWHDLAERPERVLAEVAERVAGGAGTRPPGGRRRPCPTAGGAPPAGASLPPQVRLCSPPAGYPPAAGLP